MSDAANPDTANPDTAAPPAAPARATPEDALLREIVLDLADAARQFALILLDRAKHARAPDEAIRLAAAFDRTSRAARRAILLARHLDKPAVDTRPLRSPKPKRDPRAEQARAVIARDLAQAVATGNLDPDAAEISYAFLRDRLDQLDATPNAFDGPLAPIVDSIKHDLQRVFDDLSKPLYKPRTPNHRDPSGPAPPPPAPD